MNESRKTRSRAAILPALAVLAAVLLSLLSEPHEPWPPTAGGPEIEPTAAVLPPERRPFGPGEELLYVFGWEGAPGAQCRLSLSEEHNDGVRQWVLSYEGHTNEAIRRIWSYSVSGRTCLDPKTLLPSRSQVTGGKKGKTRIVTTTFDRAAGVAEVTKEKPYKNKRSVKRIPIGMGLDLPAALLFLRALDLTADRTTAIEVISSDKLYVLDLRPLRREKVKVKAGTFDALVLGLRVRLADGSEQERAGVESKYRRIRLWISDDEARLPLKMESEILLGSVYAELVSVKRRPSASDPLEAGPELGDGM